MKTWLVLPAVMLVMTSSAQLPLSPDDITTNLVPAATTNSTGHPVGSYVLSWTPSDDPRTQGYMVRYGNAPNALLSSQDAGNETNATVSDLDLTRAWYFGVDSYYTNCCPWSSTNSAGMVMTNQLLLQGDITFPAVILLTSNVLPYCYVTGTNAIYVQWATNGGKYSLYDGPSPYSCSNLVFGATGSDAPIFFSEREQAMRFFKSVPK